MLSVHNGTAARLSKHFHNFLRNLGNTLSVKAVLDHLKKNLQKLYRISFRKVRSGSEFGFKFQIRCNYSRIESDLAKKFRSRPDPDPQHSPIDSKNKWETDTVVRDYIYIYLPKD